MPSSSVIPFVEETNSTSRDRLPVALDNGKHQCVKWEPLSEWVKERSFDPQEPGLVVHPKLGAVFANGQGGDKIGINR